MNQVIQQVSDFLQTLTWIDYVIVLGVARGAFVGLKSGGYVELWRWVIWILTLAAILSFTSSLSGYVQDHTLLSAGVSQKAVMVLLGLLVFTLLRLIVLLILKIATMDNNWPMKIIGTILGGLRWATLISFALFAMNSTQLFTVHQEDLDKSRWGNAIQPIAPAIVDFAKGVVPEASLGLKRVESKEKPTADSPDAAGSDKTSKETGAKSAKPSAKKSETSSESAGK